MRFANWLAVLALLCPTAAFAQDTPQSLTVTLSDYAFSPGAIALKANAPVHLHLVNAAAKAHSFSAPEFFAAAMLAPQDIAKVRHGMIDLEGHQSLDLTVTPLQPGTYALRCSHFMHAAMGMTASITVQ